MTEPDHETPTPVRSAAGHARRQSSLAGFKPFLLAGLLVVIGLLVGLNFLLGGSGDSSDPNAEPVAGAITIGPPPGGFPERDTPLAPSPEPSARSSGRPSAGGAPVSPSEFTFYETLKKPSNDPAATVGLTPTKARATAAPQKSPSNPPAKTAPAPSAPKPLPVKSRVIETTTTEHGAHQYTIQIAAFRQQEQAEQMIKELTRKGHEAYLATASSSAGDGKTYRVRVGRFATREEANRTARQLAATEKLHPFITTIDPEVLKKG